MFKNLWLPLIAVWMTFGLIGSLAYANDPASVKARPLIAGDQVKDFKIQDVLGNTKMFTSVLKGQYIMLIFVPAEGLQQRNLRAYFMLVRSYIEQLGYQIIVITTKPNEEQRKILYERKDPGTFVDADRSAFMAMGLADSNADGASVIPGIFFVSPTGKVLSQFTSADNHLPFSGDALVLSARVYKQIEEKNQISGVRSGPTIAPQLFDPPTADKPMVTTSPATNAVTATDTSFALPDESVLRLLTIDDTSRTNSYWFQGDVGVTAYDARRNTWSPRWSPGLQFGRRFNQMGVFVNLALDQTFDLTQEIKRLDLVHLGVGVENLAFYGRVRSSFSAGLSILNSDTDIDSRGKVGWYTELRPIGFRWGSGSRGAFELTPLALNISVPVTRGIPLILVGYMTVFSFEWALEPKR